MQNLQKDRPLHVCFSTFDMDKLGKIDRHQWKERRNISKIAKRETSPTTKSEEKRMFSQAKRFRKTRLKSKWNTTFWVVPAEISRSNETSEKVACFSGWNIPNRNSCSISLKPSL